MPAPLGLLRALLIAAPMGMGAISAHLLTWGRIDELSIVLAVVVPVVLARVLTRRRLNVYGATTVALISQALLHITFVSTCATPAGCLLTPGQTVGTHALTAVITVGLALGGERAIWQLLTAAAARLRWVLPHLPVIPVLKRCCTAPKLRVLTNQFVSLVSPNRGPPLHPAFA